MPRRAIIVGAGLAGSLLAVYLARANWRVLLVERRADPRTAGLVGGRSINLALSIRGITALRGAGGLLLDHVMRDAVAMPGRMIHSPQTNNPPVFQPYSAHPTDAINSVSRAGLNLTLIDAAAAFPNVELIFSTACEGVDFDNATPADGAPVHFRDAAAREWTDHADLIIAADGAYSAVRASMIRADRYDYSQSYLTHGYKELRIPPADECNIPPALHDGFAMQPAALHIWPRGGSMMIALPNADRSFTCTLFWPYEGDHSFDAVHRHPGGVTGFFQHHYPDAVPLMPTLEHDFAANPVGSLVTIRCKPWTRANAVLLGDAAHAIVPFFGQGMNAAFEDVTCLAKCLGDAHSRTTIADAIGEYQNRRILHADAIADMALENFVEMRDKVARPEFRYTKRVEQALHRLHPDRVVPLYNLVSFSNVPYADARETGRRTAQLVDRVVALVPMNTASSMSERDWESAIQSAWTEVVS